MYSYEQDAKKLQERAWREQSLKNTRKYHIHIPKKDVLEPVSRSYYVETKDFTVEFATKIELYDWLQRHPEANFEGCVYVK